MKKGRFTEEQIIGVLKQHEAGRKIPELAREIGVSEATIYTWKSKYGGMDVNEAQRLEGLGDENRRLKHLVAGLSPDKEALKAIAQKTAGASMRRHPMSTKKLTGCCSRRSRPSQSPVIRTERSGQRRARQSAAKRILAGEHRSGIGDEITGGCGGNKFLLVSPRAPLSPPTHVPAFHPHSRLAP